MAKRTYINADEELIVRGKLILEGNIEQRQFVENIEFTQQDFAGDILVVNSDGADSNGNATTASIRLQSGNAFGSFSFTESANIIAADANISAPYFIGAISSADGLTSAVNIVLSTDATGSSSFQNGGDTATIPVTLATVNTDVGSFGDAATVPSFTVNGKGLITAANETAVNITSAQISDFVSAVRGNVSHADAGGDGSFAYNSTTGVFTYTGPSASEVRAHFSAGTGLTYSGGQFSITNTAVSAGTYGTSNDVSQITINAQGQITSASDVAIDHDALQNFVADEHVAHSSVNITAGAGLTGGGDISASRTINVATADSSIVVNADDIQVSESWVEGLFSVNDTGGDGSLSYAAGVFTYAGPNSSEIRNHFSASNGVDYNSTTGAFQAVESEIQHDSLDGFVADEHVAHSGVTLTAGDGLSGGGDISSSRSFAVDSTVVRTSGNQSIAGDKTFTGTVDLSGATVPGFTVTGNLEVTGNVNSLNYVDLQVQNSEIILNSNVSIAQDAFVKVERGGTGSDTYIKWDEGTDRWQFSNDGSTDNDMLLYSDFSAVDNGGDGSFSYANGVYTYTGPSAAETRAHFSVNDTGGDGSLSYSNGVFTYTGPSASEVRAHISGGTGIDFSSGVISTTDSEIIHDNLSGFVANEHVDHSSITLSAGAGLTGGGDITANRTFNIGEGTGITVSADQIATNDSEIVHDNLSGFVANEHIDHSGVTLTAGDGLSGGGDITTSRSFAVDSSVVRTSGNQSLAGTKTFSDSVILPNSATASAGAIYTDNANSKAYVYLNGSAIEITPAVNAGDVEAVGSGDVNIYAGSRASGNTTIHGIKSISDSTYSTISEASNVITVDANITAIRGAFSAVDNAGDGTFSYNNATGVFSYSGVSQSQIRGEFSASGSELSYNSSTGVFTSTADNYSNWTLETDSGNGSAENISSQEKVTIQGGTNITVTNVGNVITVANDNSADITAVTAGTGLTGGGNSGAVSLAVDNSHVRGLISASGDISYNSTTGVISFTAASAPVTSVNTQTGAVVLDTGDIAEGTNLYYTDARADTRATLRITAADIGNLNNVNGGTPSTGDFLLYDGSEFGLVTFSTEVNSYADARIGAASIQDLSDVVGSGVDTLANGDTLLYDSSNSRFNLINLGSEINSYFDTRLATKDTGDLAEGTNLYFTNARADARVSNALSGDVTIGGNLTVSGTQTIINTETLTVDDNMIVLNNNEAGTPSQDAGIEVERGTSTNVKFQFKESTDRWQFTNDGSTYFNLPTSTADVAEFSNLYFTNARARSALSVSGDLSYNSSTGVFSFTERSDSQIRALFSASGDISYNSSTGVFSFTNDAGDIEGVTAGAGLTGGGTSGTVTLNVVGGSGITANANDIAIDYDGLAGDMLPTNDSTYDLGSSSKRWAQGWFDDVYTTEIYAGSSTTSSSSLALTIEAQAINDTNMNNTTDKTAGSTTVHGGNSFAFNANRNAPGEPGSGMGGIGGDLNLYGGSGSYINGDVNIGTSQTRYVYIDNNRWPTSTGSSGQVLTVGGSGVLSWATPTTGDITGVSVSGTGLSGGGTSGAVTITSNATSNNTASTIVARDSSGNFSAGVISATATSARYADLAEMYSADANYDPGTVLVIGGNAEVTVTDEPGSYQAVGVVSTDPAYLMNKDANGVAVALRGRVPCKVAGVCKKGDVLITSDLPGHAMVAADPKSLSPLQIIGRALANKTEAAPGVVEILV